ncbi:MAG: hypothetical protein EBQ80_06045 [Proteobacteria bacterium]|nr:hypothetical protein [Pseudomonadota bacterium]
MPPETLVLSTRYQTFAPLLFHAQPANAAYLNLESRRPTHYDLWPQPNLQAQPVLYVSENPHLSTAVSSQFQSCTPQPSLQAQNRSNPTESTRSLHLWYCTSP